MYRTLLIAVVVTFCCTSLLARDIFVDNTLGDDRGVGLSVSVSIGGPVRTIAKALRLAEPGDRVIIANTGQPYRESVSLSGTDHSGSEIAPFVIEGNGATLDGTMPVDPRLWSFTLHDTFSFLPARKGYQQFFLAGEPLKRRASPPWGPVPALTPLEWCFWNGGIFFRPEETKLPQDYDFECCGLATGITLYHVRGVVINDLTIQGYAIDGLNALDAARYIQLNNVHCHHNGRSGISVGGASTVEINQATLADNGAGQLRVEGVSVTAANECRITAGFAPAILREGGSLTIDGKRPGLAQSSKRPNSN